MKRCLVLALSVLILLGISTVARATDPWTKEDSTTQIFVTALLVGDWLQTRDIALDNTGLYHEDNKVLGQHPSVGKVDTFFVLSILGDYYIARKLDQPYRGYWQAILIIVEAGCIYNNDQLGIKFNTRF